MNTCVSLKKGFKLHTYKLVLLRPHDTIKQGTLFRLGLAELCRRVNVLKFPPPPVVNQFSTNLKRNKNSRH